MPRFDGSGPSGDGRPGKGLGPCGRFNEVYRPGGGLGRRLGFRGRFSRFVPDQNESFVKSEDAGYIQAYNKDNLKLRKKELEREIKWLNDELKELKQGEE